MAANTAKIILSRSQDIPFNKLVLSQANVRKVKAGVSIADLAEDWTCPGKVESHHPKIRD